MGRPIYDDHFLLLFNAHWEPINFTLPPRAFGSNWQIRMDTTTGAVDPPNAKRWRARSRHAVDGRSLMVLSTTVVPTDEREASHVRAQRASPTHGAQVVGRADSRPPHGSSGVTSDRAICCRAVHRCRLPLRRPALPPMRPQWPEAARCLAGLLAQLRRRQTVGDSACGDAAGLRPGRHPLRPGQQLRPAVRVRGAQRRSDPGRGLRSVPRRAGHLHQGRLGHVARSVRGPRLAKVPDRKSRPVPGQAGSGLRRHLLPPPARSRDAPRGDHVGARRGRTGRQGSLRRASPRTHPSTRPGRPRCCASWGLRC